MQADRVTDVDPPRRPKKLVCVRPERYSAGCVRVTDPVSAAILCPCPMNDKSDYHEPYASARRRMVDEHLRARGITDDAVLDAMGRIPREAFLPTTVQPHAYDDRALSVGLQQTISQPYIVAYMTEALSLTKACRVLEIGTGTGYQTAVLSLLAGYVFTIERLPELGRRARATLRRLGFSNVTLIIGDGTLGLPAYAPFNRVIVTAGAPRVPPRLVEQLAPDGIIVVPVGGAYGQRIVRVVRDGDRAVQKSLLPCRFVKLVGEDAWRESGASRPHGR